MTAEENCPVKDNKPKRLLYLDLLAPYMDAFFGR